jgi:hypothetical protein
MNTRLRNGLVVLIGVIIAFGIGAGWQFTEARRARGALGTATTELETTRLQLEQERVQNTLALAVVAAQLGNFERSRQLASDFFTTMQNSAAQLPAGARAGVDQILAQRDATITLLSRSAPESGLHLARLLSQLRQALGGNAAGLAPAAAQPADTTRN